MITNAPQFVFPVVPDCLHYQHYTYKLFNAIGHDVLGHKVDDSCSMFFVVVVLFLRCKDEKSDNNEFKDVKVLNLKSWWRDGFYTVREGLDLGERDLISFTWQTAGSSCGLLGNGLYLNETVQAWPAVQACSEYLWQRELIRLITSRINWWMSPSTHFALLYLMIIGIFSVFCKCQTHLTGRISFWFVSCINHVLMQHLEMPVLSWVFRHFKDENPVSSPYLNGFPWINSHLASAWLSLMELN